MTKAKLGTYGEDEIRSKLEELPGWYFEDGWIRRQYKTDGWLTTVMLVNQIAIACVAVYGLRGVYFALFEQAGDSHG